MPYGHRFPVGIVQHAMWLYHREASSSSSKKRRFSDVCIDAPSRAVTSGSSFLRRSLKTGEYELSCVDNPTAAELLCLTELSDEELQAGDLVDIVPHAVCPKAWRVSNQALDILVRQAEQGFRPDAPVILPWVVPPDFFDRAGEFVVSEVVFTRAIAREQRSARETANATMPGKRVLTLSKVPEDLPF
ncbi:hypothetical protein [Deinococcus ruber]|uniref:Uncharacterized protein n=1 Tax=Deinococcus ruber TaxID=1848197 RepID=A0A918CQN8_9DEIO|nr:hypothetical protein [Deinococcus ruber]GGR33931.1 hypothetical protein GCM10008957_50230 [Deinococcus ruber]